MSDIANSQNMNAKVLTTKPSQVKYRCNVTKLDNQVTQLDSMVIKNLSMFHN